jgi:rhodanese-related sulfurtransferase
VVDATNLQSQLELTLELSQLGRPVLLICNTQNRSSATLTALRERGYAHVRYVQGGMSEWVRRGWPVVRP